MTIKLPPLPKSKWFDTYQGPIEGFVADQMQDYALAAIEAYKQQQQQQGEEQEREAFEIFISNPPYERSTDRLGVCSSWAGHYNEYMVQLAWEAWKARAHGIGGEK